MAVIVPQNLFLTTLRSSFHCVIERLGTSYEDGAGVSKLPVFDGHISELWMSS